MVVGPTGALGAAVLLDGVDAGRNRRIGVVINGGSVALPRTTTLFETQDLV